MSDTSSSRYHDRTRALWNPVPVYLAMFGSRLSVAVASPSRFVLQAVNSAPDRGPGPRIVTRITSIVTSAPWSKHVIKLDDARLWLRTDLARHYRVQTYRWSGIMERCLHENIQTSDKGVEKHGGVGFRQGAYAMTSSGCFVYLCRNAGRSITLCLAAWLMDSKHNVNGTCPAR